MRPQLALKIDIDTFVGLRDGAPTLARLLEARGLRASFFVSCGPDHSGRAIRRVFRPGFLAKMRRTNAPSLYGWRTILYGTLLPGPQIARSFPDLLRRLAADGHEVGVHGYDHVYWHDRLDGLSAQATAAEFRRGLAVYREIFGTDACSFASPGWQCTAASLDAIDAAGLQYHSCTRGTAPYLPVANGRAGRTPEIPTTWPTLDEMYGLEGTSPCELTAFYVRQVRPGLNVHTVHTEAEGLGLAPHFEALLDALRPQVEFVRLTDVARALPAATLSHCRLDHGLVRGRAGTVALQGPPT